MDIIELILRLSTAVITLISAMIQLLFTARDYVRRKRSNGRRR